MYLGQCFTSPSCHTPSRLWGRTKGAHERGRVPKTSLPQLPCKLLLVPVLRCVGTKISVQLQYKSATCAHVFGFLFVLGLSCLSHFVFVTVFDILMRYTECGDWTDALQVGVARRAGLVPRTADRDRVGSSSPHNS